MKEEAAIQKAITDYLALKKIWFRRMNSGATLSSYGGKTRMVRYGSPGMADILATPLDEHEHDGVKIMFPVILWIECKTSSGKQSDAQRAFQEEVEAEGHYYLLARSLDDVIAFL